MTSCHIQTFIFRHTLFPTHVLPNIRVSRHTCFSARVFPHTFSRHISPTLLGYSAHFCFRHCVLHFCPIFFPRCRWSVLQCALLTVCQYTSFSLSHFIVSLTRVDTTSFQVCSISFHPPARITHVASFHECDSPAPQRCCGAVVTTLVGTSRISRDKNDNGSYR